MNKKMFIILGIVILGLICGGYTQLHKTNTKTDTNIPNNIHHPENTAIKNNTTVNENKDTPNIGKFRHIDTRKDNDVVVILKQPHNTYKRGVKIPISYTVTNKGKNTVYKVGVANENFEQDVGTLKPGETRKYIYMVHIPTDEDIKEMTGTSGSAEDVSNPYRVCVSVTFTDNNGIRCVGSSYGIGIKWRD